jgi:hypothetical protein
MIQNVITDYSNDSGYLVTGEHRSAYEAWVAPDGSWYNMYELGNHWGFANTVINMLHPKPDGSLCYVNEDAIQMLLNEGWIMTQGWCGPVILRGYQNMSRPQFEALLAIIGDKPIFRGLSIRGLWLCKDVAKMQAESD